MAVNNISMDLGKNKLHVLLGQNGSGKSTTLHLIVGILNKTAGIITINGETNVDNYRHTIGYCPQYNVFFPYLTCFEHLLFIGRVSICGLFLVL